MVELSYFTLNVIFDSLPSLLSTTTSVAVPLAKFTVSYAATKSFSTPLPWRFQPVFKTSCTVAASLRLSSVKVVGASCLLTSLPFGLATLLVSGKWLVKLDNVSEPDELIVIEPSLLVVRLILLPAV